jgi:1-acyl-sn-glycerol-3-phosphate acyltransferase
VSLKYLLRRLVVLTFKTIIFALARIDIEGLDHVPRKGSLIVASNHIGHLDPLLTVAYMPRLVRFLALSDLFALPHAVHLLRLFDAISVHRDQQDKRALIESLKALRHGQAIGLFPEGRMSLTGSLERARTGTAYLARATNAAILPVAFTGTEHFLPNLRRWRRSSVRIRIGQPLRLQRSSRTGDPDELQRDTACLMGAIATLLPAAYKGVYGPAGADPSAKPETSH